MTYRGRVKNGVVVLDDPTALPDGAEVSIRQVRSAKRRGKGQRRLTLYERLKPVIGKAKGFPPDASLNVDHYLYGAPKEE